jgi:hypothetical protein
MKGMVKFGRKDRDMLYYFSGTRLVDTDTVQLVNSLTTAPVTLDINIAHGLLGHPDTRSVTAMATKNGWTLNRILGHLQPFRRIAYVTNRNKIKAKLDVRSTNCCVFVGYAVDHSGDTFKFHNPLTKSTILSRDVHQWMEWHGQHTTATDDMDLFTELKKLQMDSVILPSTPVVPILTDADLPDNSTLSEVPALAPIAEDVPATQVPTGVVPPARRNLTSSFGQGAITLSRGHQGVVTRSQVRHVTWTLKIGLTYWL